MNAQVEIILNNARIQFDAVVSDLTQPGISPAIRMGKLQKVKGEVTKILQELVAYKKQFNVKEDVDKINEFISLCNVKYQEVINYATGDLTGDGNQEYVQEALNEAKNSTIIPAAILTGNSREEFIRQTQQQPSRMFNSQSPMVQPMMPAISADQIMAMTAINISTGISMVDGETIPAPAPADMIYIIDPCTKSSQIVITRFVNPDAATSFVYDNFRNDKNPPVIIYGKLAEIEHKVNLVI